jgi:hypothetical protein
METIIAHLAEAFKYVIDSVDWVYLVMFMLTCYVILKGFEVKLQAWRLKTNSQWFTKTRTIVLVVGLVYAIGFGLCKYFWGLPWHNPVDILSEVSAEHNVIVLTQVKQMPYGYVLFFSFILGQFLNLYGIDKLVDSLINAFKGIFHAGIEKFKKS